MARWPIRLAKEIGERDLDIPDGSLLFAANFFSSMKRCIYLSQPGLDMATIHNVCVACGGRQLDSTSVPYDSAEVNRAVQAEVFPYKRNWTRCGDRLGTWRTVHCGSVREVADPGALKAS
jgi:hypothetical protein